MRIFYVAAMLSCAAFVVHWILWRVHVPRRQTAALLVIFSGTLAAGLAAASSTVSGSWRLDGWWETLHVALFHISTMLAYVVAYSALEERSPSMSILVRVADSRNAGTPRREIEAALKALSPVEVRLRALVRDGMVKQLGREYELTAKGRRWAAVFSSWRRILGFGKGG
jgi:hypothetical protein